MDSSSILCISVLRTRSMDPVEDIKARLPIEELVGQYCQLKKQGRNFVCLCPFHNDTHPSMQVSPEKGIAYCFACQTGGDIFSFYQTIEGVDFRQALKDLAEKVGVKLETAQPVSGAGKDEKERARACLEAAAEYYRAQLASSQPAQQHLAERLIGNELIEHFGIGYAPDSFSDTYQHLLKEGFSRRELLAAGLGVQKELAEERMYDRFRNRIMFPIRDYRGDLVGFGGRTLGEDDAKYINSSEGLLFNKSRVLYGLFHAKEAVREHKKIVLVEGYFDVIACHRIGVQNVVSVSGTALTEEHVKILKRYAETVILCLDQDQAGRDAAERAFLLCAQEGLQVYVVPLQNKDPDEAARAEPELLKQLLAEGAMPYMDLVLREIGAQDLSGAQEKRAALQRLLPLLNALPTSVEREHELGRAAGVLGTTQTALAEDVERYKAEEFVPPPQVTRAEPNRRTNIFSPVEITLGLFLLYPHLRQYIKELLPPEEGFAGVLFEMLKELPEGEAITLDGMNIPEEFQERTGILLLYCEHHGFQDWSEVHALRELRQNCVHANRETLKIKQREISKQLFEAHREGKVAEAEKLSTQYQQLLKLAKMAG